MENLKNHRIAYDLCLFLPGVPEVAIHKIETAIDKLPKVSEEEKLSSPIVEGMLNYTYFLDALRLLSVSLVLSNPELMRLSTVSYVLFTALIIAINHGAENELSNFPKDRK